MPKFKKSVVSKATTQSLLLNCFPKTVIPTNVTVSCGRYVHKDNYEE